MDSYDKLPKDSFRLSYTSYKTSDLFKKYLKCSVIFSYMLFLIKIGPINFVSAFKTTLIAVQLRMQRFIEDTVNLITRLSRLQRRGNDFKELLQIPLFLSCKYHKVPHVTKKAVLPLFLFTLWKLLLAQGLPAR